MDKHRETSPDRFVSPYLQTWLRSLEEVQRQREAKQREAEASARPKKDTARVRHDEVAD